MIIWIVMEDLGDSDVALRYFKTEEEALGYMKDNEEWCYYESNPRVLNTQNTNWMYK